MLLVYVLIVVGGAVLVMSLFLAYKKVNGITVACFIVCGVISISLGLLMKRGVIPLDVNEADKPSTEIVGKERRI